MKSIEIKVGERIRTLRESRGLLQRQLASEAGLPARTVGRIERGEAPLLRAHEAVIRKEAVRTIGGVAVPPTMSPDGVIEVTDVRVEPGGSKVVKLPLGLRRKPCCPSAAL